MCLRRVACTVKAVCWVTPQHLLFCYSAASMLRGTGRRGRVLGRKPGWMAVALCSTLQGTEQASAAQQHVLWQLCWSQVLCTSKCKDPVLPKAGKKPWAKFQLSGEKWAMPSPSSAVRCRSIIKPDIEQIIPPFGLFFPLQIYHAQWSSAQPARSLIHWQ